MILNIRDLEIKGKKVFLRLDFNVPIQDSQVIDDSRIVEALPTIQYALEKGAKLVIASHLGRPQGKDPALSLEPVAVYLAQLLGEEITLADDCIGEGIELMVQSLRPGQALLLENLRFHHGEEANGSVFAHQLSKLGEVYVTDAFGTAHRKHASTYGVPAIIPVKGMGFLIEKELEFLNQLLYRAEKPFYAILGGSKVTDKIKTVASLLRRVQGLVIGGAMAHAFWKVEGREIPKAAKQPKLADIEAAQIILREARKRDIPILLPKDTQEGFDIGPATIHSFNEFLSQAKTIFWNGPLGWFEKPEYAVGTFEVAKFVGTLSAVKVIGGGDTVAAIKQSGASAQFDHLSTGGGAILEYLEQETLPGIEVLTT